MDNHPFCCPKVKAQTQAHSYHERTIYHFARNMIFPTTPLPAARTYLPESQQNILETADHVIQYEKKLVTGETVETRYFIANLEVAREYFEISRGMMDVSSAVREWVPGRDYIKLRCEEHSEHTLGRWYLICVMEREGDPAKEKTPNGEKETAWHVLNAHAEDSC